mmetsp:Transcript_49511/g.159933  ORF Transcript_49511/g.159933 Transcript_49511/m.159933 type:complete len:228 (-) Transcript_49511:761-1444(-)
MPNSLSSFDQDCTCPDRVGVSRRPVAQVLCAVGRSPARTTNLLPHSAGPRAAAPLSSPSPLQAPPPWALHWMAARTEPKRAPSRASAAASRTYRSPLLQPLPRMGQTRQAAPMRHRHPLRLAVATPGGPGPTTPGRWSRPRLERSLTRWFHRPMAPRTAAAVAAVSRRMSRKVRVVSLISAWSAIGPRLPRRMSNARPPTSPTGRSPWRSASRRTIGGVRSPQASAR